MDLPLRYQGAHQKNVRGGWSKWHRGLGFVGTVQAYWPRINAHKLQPNHWLELVADTCFTFFSCFSKSGLMGDFFAVKRLDSYVFGHCPF